MNVTRRAGRFRPAAAVCLLTCLAATGCGSQGSVSGKVSYKGEALGGGTVVFTSEGRASDSSPIALDGTYHINKIPTGPVKVAVETKSARPIAADPRRPNMPTPPPDQMPAGGTSAYGTPGAPTGKYVWIPDDYGDPAKSGLTYDVKPGSQTKDFDLPAK